MGTFDVSPIGWAEIDEASSRQVDSVLDDVLSDARSFVPRDTGELADSLEKDFVEGDLEGYVKVGTSHWAPNEFGSRAHTIRIKDKKVLAGDGAVYGKEVQHPGTPAQPFMRPALFQRRALRKGVN